jgi:hypothetical protein
LFFALPLWGYEETLLPEHHSGCHAFNGRLKGFLLHRSAPLPGRFTFLDIPTFVAMEDKEPLLYSPLYVNVPSGYGLVIATDGLKATVLNKVGSRYVSGKPAPVMDWDVDLVKPETRWQKTLRHLGLLRVA